MIDPKIREVWRMFCAQTNFDSYEMATAANILTRAYLDAEARARMAEFWRYHDEHDPESCMECDSVKTVDEIDLSERHTWTLAQWRAELEREMNT